MNTPMYPDSRVRVPVIEYSTRDSESAVRSSFNITLHPFRKKSEWNASQHSLIIKRHARVAAYYLAFKTVE